MQENAHILFFMPWTVPFSWRGHQEIQVPNMASQMKLYVSYHNNHANKVPMKDIIKIGTLVLKTNLYKIIFKCINKKLKIYNIDTIHKQPRPPLSIGKQINPHKPKIK